MALIFFSSSQANVTSEKSLFEKLKLMTNDRLTKLNNLVRKNFNCQQWNSKVTSTQCLSKNVFLGYVGSPENSQTSLQLPETYVSESCILVCCNYISGVVQLEDAPRTGTIEHIILVRITTVSANVQGGIKRDWDCKFC